jgi:hypothetical protein
MTLFKYFKANRKTILSLYKIIGAYATGGVALLFIVTRFEFTSIMDVLYLFITCVVLGHLITFSLVLLYLSANYDLFRDQVKFYYKLKEELINEFKIILYNQPLNGKYGLLEVHIYCLWKGYLFNLMPNRSEKQIGISVINDFSEIDFHEITKYIDKQYKVDSICMTGFGIRKIVKSKEWELLGIDDLKQIFAELVDISELEELDVVKVEQSEE